MPLNPQNPTKLTLTLDGYLKSGAQASGISAQNCRWHWALWRFVVHLPCYTKRKHTAGETLGRAWGPQRPIEKAIPGAAPVFELPVRVTVRV
jgi:hypothetical protein